MLTALNVRSLSFKQIKIVLAVRAFNMSKNVNHIVRTMFAKLHLYYYTLALPYTLKIHGMMISKYEYIVYAVAIHPITTSDGMH